MEQPLILKKQVISWITLIILLLFQYTYNIYYEFIKITIFYTIVVSSITFVPYLSSKINCRYIKIINAIVYYLPMVLPLFLIKYNRGRVNNIYGISLSIVIGIGLIISNITHNKKFVSSANIKTLMPIEPHEVINELYLFLIPPICEELFYRYFLLNEMRCLNIVLSILISAALFLYSHFINRWANVMFNKRSYIYHFVTGVVFAIIYIYTGSIIGCILAHYIFNSPMLLVLYKRIKRNKQKDTQLFNDYF